MSEMQLAEVLGCNLQKIRTDNGVTTDEVARVARGYGLKWSDSRVSAMEKGKVAPTVPTLVAVALTLGDLIGRQVSLHELAAHEGLVRLNDDLTVRGDRLVGFLQGEPVSRTLVDTTDSEKDKIIAGGPERVREFYTLNAIENSHEPVDPKLLDAAERQAGSAEMRAAADLGVTTPVVAHASVYLWKNTFSDERDRRAGADANAQKRGQVTRQMKAELRAMLEGLDDGNDQ